MADVKDIIKSIVEQNEKWYQQLSEEGLKTFASAYASWGQTLSRLIDEDSEKVIYDQLLEYQRSFHDAMGSVDEETYSSHANLIRTHLEADLSKALKSLFRKLSR